MTDYMKPVHSGEQLEASTVMDMQRAIRSAGPLDDGRTSRSPDGSYADPDQLFDREWWKESFQLYEVREEWLKIRGDQTGYMTAIGNIFSAPVSSSSSMAFDTKIDLSAKSEDQIIYVDLDRANEEWSLEIIDASSWNAGTWDNAYIPLWYIPLNTSETDARIVFDDVIDLRHNYIQNTVTVGDADSESAQDRLSIETNPDTADTGRFRDVQLYDIDNIAADLFPVAMFFAETGDPRLIWPEFDYDEGGAEVGTQQSIQCRVPGTTNLIQLKDFDAIPAYTPDTGDTVLMRDSTGPKLEYATLEEFADWIEAELQITISQITDLPDPDGDDAGQKSLETHAGEYQIYEFDAPGGYTIAAEDRVIMRDATGPITAYASPSDLASWVEGETDHNELTNLAVGDVHTMYWLVGGAFARNKGSSIGNAAGQSTIDLDNQELETNGTANLAWDATDISITLGGQQMDIKPDEVKTDTGLDIITSAATGDLALGTAGDPWDSIQMDASTGGEINTWIFGNDLTVRSSNNGVDDLNFGGSAALDWANINFWIATSLSINGNTGLNETLSFGGGGTGDVATLTFTHGSATAKTLVP